MTLLLLFNNTVEGQVPVSAQCNGVSSISGSLNVAKSLSSTCAGVSSVSGSIEISKTLAAACAGISSVSGAINVLKTLAGQSDAVSTVSGDLSVGIFIAATCAGVSTVSGAIQVAKSLAAISAGVSTVSGSIDIAKQLAAIASGQSSVSAALSISRPVAALVSGVSTVSGSLTVVAVGANAYETLVLNTQSANLLGFWRLNESLGAGTAVDSSPNGNDSVALFNNTFGVSTLLGGGSNTGSSFAGDPTSFIQLENTGAGGPLSAQKFTITGWFKVASSGGYGDTTTTGTGGIVATPIIAKGRSESDTSGLNLNYFLGITSGGKLGGDFEAASGTNHPITGGTTITTGRWYFGALTYDQVSFKLYLNGVEDATSISTTSVPDYNTAQPASIATGLTSTGAADGGFNGIIDEVAIWNKALSDSEILALWNIGRVTQPITSLCAGSSSVTAALSVAQGLSDIEGFILKSSRLISFNSKSTRSKSFSLKK